MRSIRALAALAVAASTAACGILIGSKSDPPAPAANDADIDAFGDVTVDHRTLPAICDAPRAICETFDDGDAAAQYFGTQSGTASLANDDYATTPPASFVSETLPDGGNFTAEYARLVSGAVSDLDCSFAAKLVSVDDTDESGDLAFFRVQATSDDRDGAAPPDWFVTVSSHATNVNGRVHAKDTALDFYGNFPRPPIGEWIRYHVKIHVGGGGDRGDLSVEAIHLDGSPAGSISAQHDAEAPSVPVAGLRLGFGLTFTVAQVSPKVKIDDVYCVPSP